MASSCLQHAQPPKRDCDAVQQRRPTIHVPSLPMLRMPPPPLAGGRWYTLQSSSLAGAAAAGLSSGTRGALARPAAAEAMQTPRGQQGELHALLRGFACIVVCADLRPCVEAEPRMRCRSLREHNTLHPQLRRPCCPSLPQGRQACAGGRPGPPPTRRGAAVRRGDMLRAGRFAAGRVRAVPERVPARVVTRAPRPPGGKRTVLLLGCGARAVAGRPARARTSWRGNVGAPRARLRLRTSCTRSATSSIAVTMLCHPPAWR